MASYIGNPPVVSATRTVTEVIATAGQTVFTANGGYTVGYVDVLINGVQLQSFDFTATNGSTITLAVGCAAGDEVRIVAYGTFSTAIPVVSSPTLDFTGTAQRIRGDFSNATIANRVMFQTSTTNGQTSIGVLPNGTSTFTNLNLFGGNDPANASIGQFVNTGTEVRLSATSTGTGTFLPMPFYTGGSERMRIDTSGNVGIGTASPSFKLDVTGTLRSTGEARFDNAINLKTATLNQIYFDDAVAFSRNGTGERVRIDANGQLWTTNGAGTVSPAYEARAWVNFNGTGTVAIRASGNVSSITDNGVGDYTVNFATAMPDANYAATGTARQTGVVSNLTTSFDTTGTATALRIATFNASGSSFDPTYVSVAIFR